MKRRTFRVSLLALIPALIAACGGGGGSASGKNPEPGPPPPPVEEEPTYIHLSSDAGDAIGQGAGYSYTQADADISVRFDGAHLTIVVDGEESWVGEFQLPDGYTDLQPGSYDNLIKYPFHNALAGGMSWFGEGRDCATLTGWVIIDRVTYRGPDLRQIDLQFEQHCENAASALHGEIHWDYYDATSPPGPVEPPPAGLWEPAAGATPASGNYVYLESELGDTIGAGQTYAYTESDAEIAVNAAGARLLVSVTGNENWGADFEAMDTLELLTTGYYGNLERFGDHNPVVGGLHWSGEGRRCSTATGWFVVDSVVYDETTLVSIDLRFTQYCDGAAAALHGKIHWDANDAIIPLAPIVPPPPNLWEPAPGTTPATGSYVHLESEAGDWVGIGRSYTYTLDDSLLTFDSEGGHLLVNVNGDERWDGNFQAMDTLGQFEAGYYSDLDRYPFFDPARGGLDWSGQGRGCNELTGWFVVDSVRYEGATLTAIDLRFEQHCEKGTPALYGVIHWDANDTGNPPGPVVPPPDDLWAPEPGVTPTTGSYVYLESEPGDRVGLGGIYLYPATDIGISVTMTDARLDVSIGEHDWDGVFQGMDFLDELEVGYYGGLHRDAVYNPVKGGMSWFGLGRGCNTLLGWFVIDNLVYDGTTVQAVDLRFEQHCEEDEAALHGKIHWSQ